MAKVSKRRGLTITVDRALGERLSEGVWRKLDRMLVADARLGALVSDEPSGRKPQRKPAQEAILRRVREKYPPNGDVGDSSVAEVRRTISSKAFNPTWDSVNRALGRASKK